MTKRARSLACAAAILLMAAAPIVPNPITATGARAQNTWFDPSQLPAFTGTVERYLPNPAGGIDALLFREGSQVVFPATMAEALRAAAPPGRTLVVYGLRARTAAVVTMLAWAPNGEAEPAMVDHPVWRISPEVNATTTTHMTAAGTVRTTLLSPQGDPVGALLEDGTVVRLPLPVAEALAARLKPGAKLAVSGSGADTQVGRAIAVSRIGGTPDTLEAITASR